MQLTRQGQLRGCHSTNAGHRNERMNFKIDASWGEIGALESGAPLCCQTRAPTCELSLLNPHPHWQPGGNRAHRLEYEGDRGCESGVGTLLAAETFSFISSKDDPQQGFSKLHQGSPARIHGAARPGKAGTGCPPCGRETRLHVPLEAFGATREGWAPWGLRSAYTT